MSDWIFSKSISFEEKTMMKRFAIQLCVLIFIFGFFAFSSVYGQKNLLSEGWEGEPGLSFPAGWEESGYETWFIDDGSVTLISSCDIVGSSGGNFIVATNQYSEGSYDLNYSSLNTTGITDITVTWNSYRVDAMDPPVSFYYSTDGVNWSLVTTFADITSSGTWQSVPSFTLPAAAEGVSTLQLKISYEGSGVYNFYAVDDFTVTGVPTTGGTFYCKPTGYLNDLTTWGSNPDGSGTSPAGFDEDNLVLNIVNNSSATINGSWTVSGGNAKVVLGDNVSVVAFTIPSTAAFNGIIDVLSNGSLVIQNSTIPNFGIIADGSSIAYAGANQNVRAVNYYNLTISGPGTKSISASPAETIVRGTLTIASGTILKLASSFFSERFLTLNGTISGLGTMTGSSSSSINIGGSGDFGSLYFTQTSATTRSLRNFTINRSSGSVNLASDLVVSASLALNNGNLNVNSTTLTLNGSAISGTFPQLITASASNLVFSGTSSGVFIPSSVSQLNSLTIDNSSVAGVAMLGNIALSGALTLNANRTLNTAGYSFTGPGSAVINGTVLTSHANGFAGAFQNTGGITLDPASTVNYNGSNQSISTVASPGYGNLVLSGSGTKSAGTSNVIIRGNMSLSGTTLNTGTSTFSFTGTGPMALPPVSFYNLALAGPGITLSSNLDLGGDLTLSGGALHAGSQTINIAGNWTNSGGTFDAGTSTVNFSGGVTGYKEISEPSPFYNLTISGSDLGLNGADLTVYNTFTITEGALFNATGRNVTLAGNFINNDGFEHETGTLFFTGNSVLSGSGFIFPNVNISGTVTAPATIETLGNWSNTGVFNHNNGTVIFNGSSPQEIAGANTFYNLTQDNGEGNSVQMTGSINLINTLKLNSGNFNSNGNLTLVSNASGTARIAQIEADAGFNGDITMQRYVSGKSQGWYYLGTPIKDQTLASWSDDFLIRTVGSTATVGYWNESSNSWQMLYSLTEPLPPGRGVKAFWWSQSLPGSSLTFDNTGAPMTGPVSLNLTKTAGGQDDGGWNLVSNPYPCDVDWDAAGWTKTNMNNSFYIWDGVSKGYKVYVGAGGSNLSTGSEGITQHIPSSQAFFVYATAQGASLGFEESVKSPINQNPTFLREKTARNELRINLLNTSSQRDEAIIRFVKDGTMGFDYYDALKLYGHILNISSNPSDTLNLAVNSLPDDSLVSRMPLMVHAYANGNYRLLFKGISSFDNGKKIVLADRYLDVKTVLEDSTIYSFSMSDDAASKGMGRFEILFEDAVGLTAGSAKGHKDEIVSLPVTVSGFKNIRTAQFTLHWDPARADFHSVQNYGQLEIDEGNFGATRTSEGVLTFSWDSPDAVTLDDGDSLFVVSLKLTGQKGDSVAVTFENTPTPVEVSDSGSQLLATGTYNGWLYILNTRRIYGKVESPDGQPIKNPDIVLSSATGTQNFKAVDGTYEFEVDELQDYTLTPEFTTDIPVNNGISTLDISLIRRHILGMKPLASAYKTLAADVDLSGSVSTIDITWIRKIVLGSASSFPGNKLWIFTPAGHVYGQENPFPLTPAKQIINLTQDENVDFVGLKLGDVNESWQSPARVKQGKEFIVSVDSKTATEEVIELPVRASSFEGIAGYQFTVSWNPAELELVDVVNSKTNGAFGFGKVAQGILTTSWDHAAGGSLDLADNDTLFVLMLKVIAGKGLATVDINSEATRFMAFDNDLVEAPVASKKGMITMYDPADKNVILYQNAPNPVGSYTDFKFYLPKEDVVTLTVFSLTGQTVYKTEGRYGKGLNIITWRRNEKDSKQGVYLFSFETSDFKESKRLVIK